VLGGTVLAASLVLAGLALLVPMPRILSDELRYTIAASSLADGDGLGLRGTEYGFGPVYPAVLAAILAVVPDRETAYPLFKLANALLFALASVPIYLVGRRLLPPAWSLAVATLSLAIPSSIYVSLVMTESAAYPAAWLAILAIVLALERTSPTRQLAVLSAIVLAYLTRAQFATLFPAFVAALGLLWIVVPARRPRSIRELAGLWPTLGALALGLVLVVIAPVATGSAPFAVPSAYEDLWTGYDLVDVGRWFVYHLAALEVLLVVVPLAVSPIVLGRLLRDARAGDERAGAFATAFVTVNAAVILVTAAFASTPAGFDNLQDRYLFYVVPLWLVVLGVWLGDGLPRPVLATAVGVGLALALPGLVPFEEIAADDGAEVGAVVTHLWAQINATAFESFPEAVSGRRLLALFVVVLLAAVLLVPRRLALGLGAVVAAVLLVSTAIAWRDSLRTADDFEATLPVDREWVDEAIGEEMPVTSLYVSAPCAGARWAGNALLLTEFFNRAVTSAAHVAEPDGSLLPSTDVRVAADGSLVRESGGTFPADAVLVPVGIALRGDKLATGTAVPLVLWRVDGPVRLAGARSTRELQGIVCSARW
jgi:hypothetical protein